MEGVEMVWCRGVPFFGSGVFLLNRRDSKLQKKISYEKKRVCILGTHTLNSIRRTSERSGLFCSFCEIVVQVAECLNRRHFSTFDFHTESVFDKSHQVNEA